MTNHQNQPFQKSFRETFRTPWWSLQFKICKPRLGFKKNNCPTKQRNPLKKILWYLKWQRHPLRTTIARSTSCLHHTGYFLRFFTRNSRARRAGRWGRRRPGRWGSLSTRLVQTRDFDVLKITNAKFSYLCHRAGNGLRARICALLGVWKGILDHPLLGPARCL